MRTLLVDDYNIDVNKIVKYCKQFRTKLENKYVEGLDFNYPNDIVIGYLYHKYKFKCLRDYNIVCLWPYTIKFEIYSDNEGDKYSYRIKLGNCDVCSTNFDGIFDAIDEVVKSIKAMHDNLENKSKVYYIGNEN